MKRRVALGAVILLMLMGNSGCEPQLEDLREFPVSDPDRIQVVRNADAFPNVVALCIEGAGFAATTRAENALVRVNEWDASAGGWCAR